MNFSSFFLAALFLGNGVFAAKNTLHRKLSKKSSKKSSKNGGVSIMAYGSGAQEVPPVMTNTMAALEMEFDKAFTEVSFTLDISHGMKITQAHLHCGLAGSNGGVLALLLGDGIPIPGPGGVDIDGEAAEGTLMADDLTGADCFDIEVVTIAALYEAIQNGLVYLNIHSEANPPGEVRAQLFDY